MSPTNRSLMLLSAWLLLAAVAIVFPSLLLGWQVLGGLIALVLVVDAVGLFLVRELTVERRLPRRCALGEPGEVRLILQNDGRRSARFEVFDGIPQGAVADELPWLGVVPGGRELRLFYKVKVMERGEAVFGRVELRRYSGWGFWKRKTRALSDETVRVYPNYEPVIRYALLAMQHRESPMGIVRRPRSGSSRDFHQLREYRDGDPLVQIDWKATSRRQMLISRDYQEQRDQSIVFLLDTGRRMRAMDGDLPQFDHVLNAVLLLAHLALKQGDQVAVQTFGGSDRWLPPIKGAHAMPVLLNHLYDYQTTAAPSDFSGAVERLMTRQRRRSLVIVLTNLRGEDGKELLPALQVLRESHVVLLASMREQVVDESSTKPVDSFASALRFLAADQYGRERREILAGLSASGILTLDTVPGALPVELANRYFDIKAAGRI